MENWGCRDYLVSFHSLCSIVPIASITCCTVAFNSLISACSVDSLSICIPNVTAIESSTESIPTSVAVLLRFIFSLLVCYMLNTSILFRSQYRSSKTRLNIATGSIEITFNVSIVLE